MIWRAAQVALLFYLIGKQGKEVISCYAFKLYISHSGCQKSKVQASLWLWTLDYGQPWRKKIWSRCVSAYLMSRITN